MASFGFTGDHGPLQLQEQTEVEGHLRQRRRGGEQMEKSPGRLMTHDMDRHGMRSLKLVVGINFIRDKDHQIHFTKYG
jgi:hypothetical protein